MMQEQIYAQAIANIGERRRAAQRLQEQRTDEIQSSIPETAELDRQLRSACLSIGSVIGKGDNSGLLKEIEQHTREADAMLRRILTAHGYPADYLDVHYTCEKCSEGSDI